MTRRPRVDVVLSDEAPEGYMEWHAWADAQFKAGHRQVRCCICCLFKFPCELSRKTIVSWPMTPDGKKVRHESPICRKCALNSKPRRRGKGRGR